MLAVDASGADRRRLDPPPCSPSTSASSLVAVTRMTNLGFQRLLRERGIRVVTTDVGDRHVLEALRREGGVLGGEQSGHVIYLEGHTTGDGLVAAILLARAVVESGRSLAELTRSTGRFRRRRRTSACARGSSRPPPSRARSPEASLGEAARSSSGRPEPSPSSASWPRPKLAKGLVSSVLGSRPSLNGARLRGRACVFLDRNV